MLAARRGVLEGDRSLDPGELVRVCGASVVRTDEDCSCLAPDLSTSTDGSSSVW
jgi:hypothetical protein